MKQTNIEKLKQIVLDMINNGGTEEDLPAVIAHIEQLQQEEPSGWISVEDRLPSKMGLYLIYDENYGKPYTSTLRFTYTKKWINDSGDEFHAQYWQPLPNKPKQ